MAKRESSAPEFTRINAILPTALVARVDELRAKMRRDGLSVSYSSIVEVALTELLKGRDPASTLRAGGAKAKRA
jgi:hypothetical protein